MKRRQPAPTFPCHHCGGGGWYGRRKSFDSYRALKAHHWQAHRAVMILDEIRQCERDAAREPDQSDEAWRTNLYARRYRALLRAWWKLPGAEASRALLAEGKPTVYLTRLGEPRGSQPPAQWSLPWLRAVRREWPEAWERVKAHPRASGIMPEYENDAANVARVAGEPL